jgi:hypothetical protein
LLKKYIILFSPCHEVFYLFKNKVLYMNYINKLCLCIATLVSFSCLGMMRQVIRDENGFRVFDGQQEHTVQPYFVDSLLKRMSPEQIQRFVERGNRIRAIRLSDGEYRLQAMVPVNGGGGAGATAGFFLGHALVWGTCHTAAAVATVFGTPAAGVAVETAISTASPFIEAVAMKVGLGLGIFFGVATGPV